MTTKTWSKYQQSIFQAIESGRGNLAVNAVAGSGKTTTIVEAANRLPRNARTLFLAFNKHIVTELASRLPAGVDCMTIHSLGMKSCYRGTQSKVKVEAHKYTDLIDDLVASNQSVPPQVHGVFAKLVKQIVDLGRLTLTDFKVEEQVDDLIAHYDMAADLLDAANEIEADLDTLLAMAVRTARESMKQGMKQYKEHGIIDFTDMLWLPYVYALPVARYDVVMVDEAQDLSRAQLEIVLKAAGAGGRVIAVGDPRQAIQGFAGADNESFARIVERTRAQVLPLSVCYRCPVTHLNLAREIVPTIEAAPNAIDGNVEYIDEGRFSAMPRPGDLIICRTNAPLVPAALRLIAKGIQARVRGRNIGQAIAKIAEDASKVEIDPQTMAQGWRVSFAAQLERYGQLRREALEERKHSEAAIESLNDQIDALYAYIDAKTEIDSTKALVSGIMELFADEGAAVWCSSIHRSKGLEADRVFVLKPDKMALQFKNMLPWQAEQEQNLRYVGLTRAKKFMYFVDNAMVGNEVPGAKTEQPTQAAQDDAERLTANERAYKLMAELGLPF